MDELRRFLVEEFDLEKRIEYFKRKKFFNAEIELTNGCNLMCNYCFVSARADARKDLSSKKAKEVIDDLIAYGLKSFWWGGGEPMLNRNWYEVLKYSKEQGAEENEIFTNGLLLTRRNCRKLIRVADRINFHLDSIFPETFKVLQMKRNALELHQRILEGINNLFDEGFNPEKVRWNITLTKSSVKDIFETIEYAIKKKGIRTMNLIPLFKCGRGTSVFKREYPSKAEIKRAFHLRAKLENRPFLLKLGPSEYCKQYQLTSFAINHEGNVFPFVDYFLSCGNIYAEKTTEILDQNFDLLSFRGLVSEDTFKNNIVGQCGKCENQRYCFGNPTMTFNNEGIISKSDSNCWLVD